MNENETKVLTKIEEETQLQVVELDEEILDEAAGGIKSINENGCVNTGC